MIMRVWRWVRGRCGKAPIVHIYTGWQTSPTLEEAVECYSARMRKYQGKLIYLRSGPFLVTAKDDRPDHDDEFAIICRFSVIDDTRQIELNDRRQETNAQERQENEGEAEKAGKA